jgi:hypothetical protein
VNFGVDAKRFSRTEANAIHGHLQDSNARCCTIREPLFHPETALHTIAVPSRCLQSLRNAKSEAFFPSETEADANVGVYFHPSVLPRLHVGVGKGSRAIGNPIAGVGFRSRTGCRLIVGARFRFRMPNIFGAEGFAWLGVPEVNTIVFN